jgi:flagella basal body P-ring formation protein FlgA
MIKVPLLVKRGDRVRLVSGEGPIQVEMLGEAIEAAARGDRVRVRALDSKRIVEGWVVSASVVKMTL